MSFAGVSVIANGSLQQPSAVCSGTASGSGYHLLVVEDFSRIKYAPDGESIDSRPFMLGGYRWFIQINPNGDCQESTGFISLFLNLDQEVALPVKVYFEFSFVDQVEKQTPACIRATCAADFSSGHSSWGWGHSKFMERKALERSEHLKGDCFTIRCDIIIADPLAPFIRVPPSNMCRHFTELLETMVGTDVTVMVGGEAFVAHRCVLAARSIVFLDDLFRRRKEGTRDDVIEIEYMDASVFKAVLHFIYTDSFPKMEEVPNSMKVEGEVEDGGAESMWLQRLLAAADRYNLQRLKSMCQEKLAKHINLSSVMTLLVLATQRYCDELKEACLEFLSVQSATALKGVMSTSDWENMSLAQRYVINMLSAKFASKV